jgi:hypothetical protein
MLSLMLLDHQHCTWGPVEQIQETTQSSEKVICTAEQRGCETSHWSTPSSEQVHYVMLTLQESVCNITTIINHSMLYTSSRVYNMVYRYATFALV